MLCISIRGFYSFFEVYLFVTFYLFGYSRFYFFVFFYEGGKVYNNGSLCYGQYGNYFYIFFFYEFLLVMLSFFMESEYFMECQFNVLIFGEFAVIRGDNWNYSIYFSVMSIGLDTSFVIGWRKNFEGGDLMKMQKVLKLNMLIYK